MKKSNISKVLSSVRTSMAKHSPEILTGIGIAGMITTTVMAVRATPKALILIEDRKEEIGAEELGSRRCGKNNLVLLYSGSDYGNPLHCMFNWSQLSKR